MSFYILIFYSSFVLILLILSVEPLKTTSLFLKSCLWQHCGTWKSDWPNGWICFQKVDTLPPPPSPHRRISQAHTCICFPHNIKFCFFMCCLSLLLHVREDPVLIEGAEYLSVSVSICFSSCFLCPYRDQCVHSNSHTWLCKTSISHERRLALGVVLQQISANTSSAPCSRISTKLLPCNLISEHRVVLGKFLKSGGLMFGTRP